MNLGLFFVSSRILATYSEIKLIERSCIPPKKRINKITVVKPSGTSEEKKIK